MADHPTAFLSFNPDRTAVEIEIGEGPDDPSFGPVEIDGDDPLIVCADAEKPEQPKYLAVCGEYLGLQADTVYLLTPVETTVEEVESFDGDEDESEIEEETDDAPAV